jgi:hypothetical protein
MVRRKIFLGTNLMTSTEVWKQVKGPEKGPSLFSPN